MGDVSRLYWIVLAAFLLIGTGLWVPQLLFAESSDSSTSSTTSNFISSNIQDYHGTQKNDSASSVKDGSGANQQDGKSLASDGGQNNGSSGDWTNQNVQGGATSSQAHWFIASSSTALSTDTPSTAATSTSAGTINGQAPGSQSPDQPEIAKVSKFGSLNLKNIFKSGSAVNSSAINQQERLNQVSIFPISSVLNEIFSNSVYTSDHLSTQTTNLLELLSLILALFGGVLASGLPKLLVSRAPSNSQGRDQAQSASEEALIHKHV